MSTKSLFLRRDAVCAAVGISPATLVRMVNQGAFPAPRQLGLRAVGWLADEVQKWANARPVADNPPVAKKGGAR